MADFGLSAFVAPDVGGALNTWQWLAPEIVDPKSKSYCELSDIYSYGIVLWEIVCGDMPFSEFARIPLYSRILEDAFGHKRYEMDTLKVKSAIIENHLRPTIPSNCDETFTELIEACWKTDARKRLRFPDIIKKLEDKIDPTIIKQTKKNNLETFVQIKLEKKQVNNQQTCFYDSDSSEAEEEQILESMLSKQDAGIPSLHKLDLNGEVTQILTCFPYLWVACAVSSPAVGQIQIFDMAKVMNFCIIFSCISHYQINSSPLIHRNLHSP